MLPSPDREAPPAREPGALTSPAEDEPDGTTHILNAAARVLCDLAARSTVQHVREHGPVPARDLERAADRLREIAVELLAAGYPEASDLATRCALRMDGTADLAHLLERRPVAA